MTLTPIASSLNSLRETLPGRLQRAPHDFIRGVNPDGDRRLWSDRLLAATPQEDDLRFVFDDPHVGPVLMVAQRLPWDTEFFGFPIARVDAVLSLLAPSYGVDQDYRAAISALCDAAKQRGITYLFAAVDARDAAVARAMGENGFAYLESRAFYHRSLADYEYSERFDARLATEVDIESLGRAAAKMVNVYDRFHADPVIPRELADRMMSRWVEASIREGFADFTVVPNVPEPGAFCTVRLHRNLWEPLGLKLSQPVFSAVSTEFRGWYRRIISEICYRLKGLGSEHAYMITQTTNGAVIWVWESLGFRFGKNELIFRKLLG